MPAEQEFKRTFDRLKMMQRDREVARRKARRNEGRFVLEPSGNARLKSLAIETGMLAPGVEYWITETPMTKSVKAYEEQIATLNEVLSVQQAGGVPRSQEVVARIRLLEQMVSDFKGAMNGYVAFPKRGAPRLPMEHVLYKWIPVHGGITYAHKDQVARVWGFDTLHFDSENYPRSERSWIKFNCEILYRGLMRVAEVPWQRAKWNRLSLTEQAAIADSLREMIPEQKGCPNFEQVLALLTGTL